MSCKPVPDEEEQVLTLEELDHDQSSKCIDNMIIMLAGCMYVWANQLSFDIKIKSCIFLALSGNQVIEMLNATNLLCFPECSKSKRVTN